MKNPRNWIIAALLAALPLAVLGGVLAQQQRAITVDLRVWQSVGAPDQYYVSIRAQGGSWVEPGAIPVSLDSVTESGLNRYGDLSVSLAMPAPPAPAPVATQAPTATATPEASPTATSAPGGDGPGDSDSGGPGDSGEQGGSGPGGTVPGGEETSPTRTIAIESTATPPATPEPGETPGPTATAEPTATPSATASPMATPTATASPTAEPAATPEGGLAALEAAYAAAEAAFAPALATYEASRAAFESARDKSAAAWEAYQARHAELYPARQKAWNDAHDAYRARIAELDAQYHAAINEGTDADTARATWDAAAQSAYGVYLETIYAADGVLGRAVAPLLAAARAADAPVGELQQSHQAARTAMQLARHARANALYELQRYNGEWEARYGDEE